MRPFLVKSLTPAQYQGKPPPSSSPLSAHLNYLGNLLSYSSPFYRQLSLLSSFTVIDPPLPAPLSHTVRRILCRVNESFVTLQVKLEAKSPKSAPEVVAFGDATDAISSSLSSYSWDPNLDVVDNLRAGCACEFEGWEEVEASDGGCGVCYSMRLELDNGEVQLPDIFCSCKRSYHEACLRECLRGGEIAFGTLMGECIYCGKKIGVDAEPTKSNTTASK